LAGQNAASQLNNVMSNGRRRKGGVCFTQERQLNLVQERQP
jgi:hypothetical protein